MNFEEQVKAIKEKCRAGAGNKDFRLTKDETDILILAFQAGDRDAGQCLYDCLQGYMISVAINNGRSLMYEGHREEFLMTCQEVFFNCIDKYDCGQEARFEAYLSKAILNECVLFKKKLVKRSSEYSLVEDDGLSERGSRTRKEVDISSVSMMVDSDFEERLEAELMKPEVVALLDKLGVDHKKVIVDHIVEGKTFSQIAREENKDKSTIRGRYNKAIHDLRNLLEQGHGEVTINEDNVSYRMIKSYRNWRAELAKREGLIDFETELLPYLSDEYKYIFNNVINNYNGETLDTITKRLNKTNRYVTKAITQIFNKMDTIIYQKKTIEEFYERYGGEEGKKDLESFLSEDLKIVLNEYMLSINPEAATYVKTTYPGRFPQEMYKYVLQILNTFDNIMERKQNCESFIRRYGGRDFLLYEFGAMLSADHYKVLTETMMDYHYTTLVEYSAALGKTRSYANMAQERILEKLFMIRGIRPLPAPKKKPSSPPPSGSTNGE